MQNYTTTNNLNKTTYETNTTLLNINFNSLFLLCIYFMEVQPISMGAKRKSNVYLLLVSCFSYNRFIHQY
jgi:hypothetical protein